MGARILYKIESAIGIGMCLIELSISNLAPFISIQSPLFLKEKIRGNALRENSFGDFLSILRLCW